MPLTYPLIAWGTADDLSGGTWTRVNCTATGGQADPFGGTSAYRLDDTSSGAESYVFRNFVPTSAFAWGIWILKAGTAAITRIRLWDNTGGTDRFSADITWSGTTIAAVAGTALSPVALGNSWYAFIGIGSGVVAGNTVSYLTNPSGVPFAPTTNCYQYVRHCLLTDYLDGAVSWAEPREGSQQEQGASGTEDAWTIGTDEHLRATVRWVPDFPRNTPATVSGWYGDAPITGVMSSVKAMLTAGRDKNTLQFVPDRSACTTYMNSYLVDPMRGAPDLEPNWDRKFTMELRGSSVFTGY